MDARERLRRYLEQRREMGEEELVLDGMTVEDVLRILGAGAAGRAAPPAERERPVRRERETERLVSEPAGAPPLADPPATSDWREVLRASETADLPARERSVVERAAAPTPATAGEPESTPGAVGPEGLIVGAAAGELFRGPSAELATLDQLAEAVRICQHCRLFKTARNGVPGEGNPDADFVCVGEAPGATEDETGRPFVGQAGQLLTKILAAINLSREDVFICNVIKHRPPANRNPAPDEIAACSPYLIRQLELIRPKVILALGTFAAQTLLETKLAIGKLRGQVHRYHGIPLVVTYHPAALLRNPAWKRPTWEDVQLARRILDSAPGA
jgi:DNA polymerase